MEWEYPRPGWFEYHMEPNGSRRVRVYDYKCVHCRTITSEQHLHGELVNQQFLCADCIRKFFFDLYDVYSIPYMDEVDNNLKYTSKALGTRLPVHPKMRDKVFKRDKYQCKHCGCKEIKKLTVDHIHPYSLGGKDVFSNFQTLCRSCNSKKGAQVGYVPIRQE